MMTLTQKEILSRSYRGKSTIQRFWEKVKKKSPQQCWLFIGYIDGGGYGRVGIAKDQWLAHRLSWVINHGDVPNALYVLHRCDVRNCVNPEHLFLGTYKDNIHDAMAKGRWVAENGERIGTSKLTSKKVLKIRKEFSDGATNKAALGRKFGVTDVMIGKIVRREWWKHL